MRRKNLIAHNLKVRNNLWAQNLATKINVIVFHDKIHLHQMHVVQEVDIIIQSSALLPQHLVLIYLH